MSLKATLKERAREIGFDLVGIAPVTPGADLEFARGWVERGYAGAMHYLSNPKRFDPRAVLPGVKSVVCVGLVYDTAFPFSTEVGKGQKSEGRSEAWTPMESIGLQQSESQESEVRSQNESLGQAAQGDAQRTTDHGPRTTGHGDADGSPRAWISRYAWGCDYHEIVRGKLEELRAAIEASRPGVETRVYVDTGPIVERAFARFSGLGWMGKNTCLINEQGGSWFFLGVILTNLELAPDLPAPDRCGSCTRCLEACPTAALVEPYVMDASRCISYLTIELKGSMPQELRSGVGVNIFGCDICQDVCPWNAKGGSQESAFRSQEPGVRSQNESARQATTNNGQKTKDYGPRSIDAFSLFRPPLGALVAITEQDFRRIFRHSPIKRLGYRGWLRNLCVAMGNSGDLRFGPYLQRAAAHPDPVVREHAEWALGRLQSK
jgi:epoxyqueuosine reductase